MNTPNPLPLSSRDAQRAQFARAAVFATFGRHGRALDYDGFTDHPPHKRARRALALSRNQRKDS